MVDEINKRCKEIYNQLKFNHNNFIRYTNKLGIVVMFYVLYFFLITPIILIVLSKKLPIGGIILLVILVLLIVVTINLYKNVKKYSLTDKEFLLIRLCGVANYLNNFINSEVQTKDIDKAKEINSYLISILNPFFTTFPNLFKDRGLDFDKKFQELLLLIRKLADKKFKIILNSKRDDTELNKIIVSYRKIAFLLDKEDIESASNYIMNEFGLTVEKESKVNKILRDFSANQIVRWIVSIILLIGLYSIIYFIARGFDILSEDKVPIWAIFGVVGTFFPALSWIKNNVVDRIIDSLPYFKKK